MPSSFARFCGCLSGCFGGQRAGESTEEDHPDEDEEKRREHELLCSLSDGDHVSPSEVADAVRIYRHKIEECPCCAVWEKDIDFHLLKKKPTVAPAHVVGEGGTGQDTEMQQAAVPSGA